MYISFYLDNEFFSGELTRQSNPKQVVYHADLGEEIQFKVMMGDSFQWTSRDPVNKFLIYAVGSEIERHDEGFEPEPLFPLHYRSKITHPRNMKIEFIQNGRKYTGEANPRYSEGKLLWYEVILNTGHRFTLEKKTQSWKTDFENIPHYLIHPTGEAIDSVLNGSK